MKKKESKSISARVKKHRSDPTTVVRVPVDIKSDIEEISGEYKSQNPKKELVWRWKKFQ